MKKHYTMESEGQRDFFDNYHIPYNDDNSILVDNTDGVYHGNIIEFKLNINNTGKVLAQAIKYLSKMRVKGESIPARILLIDLNATKVYVYNSIDYIDYIQKTYVGAASVSNDAFNANTTPIAEYDYSVMEESNAVKKLLINKVKDESEWYILIDIDESCIVGWAERYYREVPNATKGDFLGDGTGKINVNGEIREPKHFKGLINPYTSPTNEKFKYLMDCLNDRLSKKDLGAFYTPIPYARKAAELVQMAVERAIASGKKDYIILDRCAGTGNLEVALIGLKDSRGDDLISHSIVSTYEYYEYKVLNERIGDKVRDIIPPTEADVVYENGKVSNADAMSKEFIENPIIGTYLNDEDCAVILFENPPYRESSSYDKENGSRGKNATYISEEMKKYSDEFSHGVVHRELANQFIWSGFKMYLRNSSDSYVLFSPIKYWKHLQLSEHEYNRGYVFNRKHFHATDSALGCIWWGSDVSHDESIVMEIGDIIDDNYINIGDMKVNKVHKPFNKYFDKRKFMDDVITKVHCEGDGTETTGRKCLTEDSTYNKNIVGYLRPVGYAMAPLNRYLTIQKHYTSAGFYLRNDNYMSKLPLFVAKCIPLDNWYEKDIYATTADGGDAYTKDKDFLKSCLIYTCLSNQNKCLTFEGSDGRHYQNELCFDEGTIASADLAKMKLDDDEKNLIAIWEKIITEARATGNCNPNWTYGVYQITKEINTSHKEGTGKSQKNVYDYPILNGYLETLRITLKEYYKSHITSKMFEYELVK